jgi:hypothetical protein
MTLTVDKASNSRRSLSLVGTTSRHLELRYREPGNVLRHDSIYMVSCVRLLETTQFILVGYLGCTCQGDDVEVSQKCGVMRIVIVSIISVKQSSAVRKGI